MSSFLFEVEKFDGKRNFEIWRLRVKPLLNSQGYKKALLGKDSKPESMSDEDWEEMDLKALCTIRLLLTDEVFLLVYGEKTTAGLWAKLETLFLDKSPDDHNSHRRKAYSPRMTLGRSKSFHTVSFGTEGLSFDIENFDVSVGAEGLNFAIWRSRVKDLLVLEGLHKALLGKGSKPESMSDNDWEVMDRKALATIRLRLGDVALSLVIRVETTVELWANLESVYLNKSGMNRIYLMRKFYSMRMEEGTKILDQLITLNGIIFQLESIGVEIKEEDKVLSVVTMLPKSYDSFAVLWGLKKDVSFDSVCKSLLDYELNNNLQSKPKGRSFNGACWLCGESGHIKKNCWKKPL